MMTKALHINRTIILMAIPFGLLIILILIMKFSLFHESDLLNLAITADLLITIPFIYYLVIRKSQIPKTTVIPVMIIGLLIGSYFLPLESQFYLNFFKTWLLPILEIGVFLFLAFKIKTAIKKYNKIKHSKSDFFEAIKYTLADLVPEKLISPLSTEIAVVYYGLFNWKSAQIKEKQFTYHKKSGTITLLVIFIFMIIIETFAVHLLLTQWSHVAAWVLSTLSVYTALQILGIAKSLSKRPIAFDNKILYLRYGIMSEIEIPLDHINSIELSRKRLTKVDLATKLSPLGDFESHNMIIHLNRTNTLNGIYGIKKDFKTLGLHIDEPRKFKSDIEKTIPINDSI